MRLPRQENAMHLQGIGSVTSIPASQLQVGMRLMWNYGYTYNVLSVREKSAHSLEIVEQSTIDGKEWTRRLKKTRQVAAWWPKRR